jgi:hypothetical protein
VPSKFLPASNGDVLASASVSFVILHCRIHNSKRENGIVASLLVMRQGVVAALRSHVLFSEWPESDGEKVCH